MANNEEPRLTDLSIQDENPDQAESECSSTTGSCENDTRDPKIRKGMERIKKLDNILSEKIKVISVLGLKLEFKIHGGKFIIVNIKESRFKKVKNTVHDFELVYHNSEPLAKSARQFVMLCKFK